MALYNHLHRHRHLLRCDRDSNHHVRANPVVSIASLSLMTSFPASASLSLPPFSLIPPAKCRHVTSSATRELALSRRLELHAYLIEPPNAGRIPRSKTRLSRSWHPPEVLPLRGHGLAERHGEGVRRRGVRGLRLAHRIRT